MSSVGQNMAFYALPAATKVTVRISAFETVQNHLFLPFFLFSFSFFYSLNLYFVWGRVEGWGEGEPKAEILQGTTNLL